MTPSDVIEAITPGKETPEWFKTWGTRALATILAATMAVIGSGLMIYMQQSTNADAAAAEQLTQLNVGMATVTTELKNVTSGMNANTAAVRQLAEREIGGIKERLAALQTEIGTLKESGILPEARDRIIIVENKLAQMQGDLQVLPEDMQKTRRDLLTEIAKLREDFNCIKNETP